MPRFLQEIRSRYSQYSIYWYSGVQNTRLSMEESIFFFLFFFLPTPPFSPCEVTQVGHKDTLSIIIKIDE